MTRLAVAVVAAALLGGCARGAGCDRAVAAELLFGLSRPGGTVSDAEFDGFLDRSVTPRFPDGLTVTDASGRWRTPDGRQVREASRRVLIVARPGPDLRARLNAIRAEYTAQFRQQSVGLVTSRVCASF